MASRRSKFESDFLYLFIEGESQSVGQSVSEGREAGRKEGQADARLKVNRDISNTPSWFTPYRVISEKRLDSYKVLECEILKAENLLLTSR